MGGVIGVKVVVWGIGTVPSTGEQQRRRRGVAAGGVNGGGGRWGRGAGRWWGSVGGRRRVPRHRVCVCVRVPMNRPLCSTQVKANARKNGVAVCMCARCGNVWCVRHPMKARRTCPGR